MKIFHVGDELPKLGRFEGIFLAGPTPRTDEVVSWRREALTILTELGYEGAVYVPETADWGWLGDYDGQVHWEWKALGMAACTLFWVPRNLENMPAFTTNVEFGFMLAMHPGRVVLGSPPGAPKMRYLHKTATDVWTFQQYLNPANAQKGTPLQGGSLRSCLILATTIAEER